MGFETHVAALKALEWLLKNCVTLKLKDNSRETVSGKFFKPGLGRLYERQDVVIVNAQQRRLSREKGGLDKQRQKTD